MWNRVQGVVHRAYERVLRREISDGPAHIAIIQDGNRRYARQQGDDVPEGHREGAQTTEKVLDWCEELSIQELTLYAFSTENFKRSSEELDSLFGLIEKKLYEFADADRIHQNEVRIKAIGDVARLPASVQESIRYAESQTDGYEGFRLNIALAYGGRSELLTAAREVAKKVEKGILTPADVDANTVEAQLSANASRDVDLIIRTGGDERTSNFLPWHANGNEAAVYFCAPYWPEFSKVDFLRGLRTYESREESWRQSRKNRAIALVRAVAQTEYEEGMRVATRLREQLCTSNAKELSAELERQRTPETISHERAD
jgi:tritrans,polycis-undecaprenyl-diphosphate synthase [geranylgeranyl-diphosphate specific]